MIREMFKRSFATELEGILLQTLALLAVNDELFAGSIADIHVKAAVYGRPY